MDLYSNLVVGLCRILRQMPQATSVGLVLEELTQGIATFVKFLTAYAVTDGAIPASRPWRRQALPRGVESRARQANLRPPPAVLRHHGGVRDADHRRQPPAAPIALHCVAAMADGFVDQLMGVANDLVVDTPCP